MKPRPQINYEDDEEVLKFMHQERTGEFWKSIYDGYVIVSCIFFVPLLMFALCTAFVFQ
jgi:hypothetical protein